VKGGYSWSDYSNVVLFDAILQQISDNYCINRNHVFVAGHSLGGWFANKLTCLRGDVINGMASIGGPGFGGNCTGPAASLIFQNANDKLVPYASGKYAETTRKNTNQCGNTTTDIMIGSFQCKKWSDCSTGNPVTWCEGYSTYQNDPHGWPTS
jgi:polyhydroxybutyrate depolymerase